MTATPFHKFSLWLSRKTLLNDWKYTGAIRNVLPLLLMMMLSRWLQISAEGKIKIRISK
jgi:hypothetical protein